MKDSLQRCIADSLECEEALLPYMAELLEDLDELGAIPQTVVNLLEPRLTPGARVLDLACGKGAVSVALAGQLGCRVVGIDAMPAFLAAAQSRAERQRVDHLCVFRFGDIRDFEPDEAPFDVVVFGAARPVLGSLREAVGKLRLLVRDEGLILIDDAWRTIDGDGAPGTLADCPTREEALKDLAAHGDSLLEEVDTSLEELEAVNRVNNKLIQRRATGLALRYPDRAALFCAYASRQLHECFLLEGVCQCVVWLLQAHKFGGIRPGAPGRAGGAFL